MSVKEIKALVVQELARQVANDGSQRLKWKPICEFGVEPDFVDDKMVQQSLVEDQLLEANGDGTFKATIRLAELAEQAADQKRPSRVATALAKGVRYEYIPQILTAISEANTEDDAYERPNATSPEEKILWNQISLTRDWIEDYAHTFLLVQQIIDERGPRTAVRARGVVVNFYKQERVALANRLDVEPTNDKCRQRGDEILIQVHRRVVSTTIDQDSTLIREDIEHAARILVVYFFLKCDLLERPPHE